MSANSGISWTDHTFNPWWGCVEVSPACDECYARTWAKRTGFDVWGADAPRRFFGDKHWNEPLKWNRKAEEAGVRARVFCASMADIAERHRDPDTMAAMDAARRDLVALIAATPWLDWLLLTKRPQDLIKLFPEWCGGFPPNVWVGVTVESKDYTWRLDVLCDEMPAAVVKFASWEPALGDVSFKPWFSRGLNWVIGGGESGGKARPAEQTWVLFARDECVAAGVAFHFKQWGEWAPIWSGRSFFNERVGKKLAGREVDGKVWDEFPVVTR